MLCDKDQGASEEDVALECEKCENPYHLQCLSPPLDKVPDGEWFCGPCAREGQGVDGNKDGKAASRNGTTTKDRKDVPKRKALDSDGDGDGDGDSDDGDGGDGKRVLGAARAAKRGRGRPRKDG